MHAFKKAMLFGLFTLGTSYAFAQSAPSSEPPKAAQPSQLTYCADDLYNQANAYARAGKPGLAVLNYERAALLAPNDPDIRANLAYVRAAAHVAVKPTNGLASLILAVNPTLVAWLGVLGVAMVGLAVVLGKMASRSQWMLRGALAVGVMLIGLTVTQAVLLNPRMHEAIVLVDQAPALVTPALMGDTAFALQEAQSVVMTAEHEDFILIRTSTGLVGWVARASLGPVVPETASAKP
jgi:hypothetical protein